MKTKKRVFLLVLDSLGIGAAPDAAQFGDEGANTLKRISASKNFNIPNLIAMGLGNVDGVDYLEKTDSPTAAVARLREKSAGKDTTTGHWEMVGYISDKPMPTYPNGFPEEIIDAFSKATGRGVLCNLPYSGTDVIRDFGDAHVKSGDLIVYTSADSVFQVAAHEDVVAPEKLYEYCRAARAILGGEHAVGRVIARPFIGESGNYRRTANRRDFSLPVPHSTVIDIVGQCILSTIAVGKISDIFAGRGFKEKYPTHSNREGMEITAELADRDFSGLCFINLVDFDMLYGHRQDIDGYAKALSEFDLWLGEFTKKLGEDDVLIITADHGCDPGDDSTDHTREYVPMLVYGGGVRPENLGTISGFDTVGKLTCDLFNVPYWFAHGEEAAIADRLFDLGRRVKVY